MNLIDSLIKAGWLEKPEIIRAFRKIKRKDFLPKGIKDLAELNEALPIGFGQTISQPLVVAFMLEKLQPSKGEKILDIGSGSGWTTSLLAEIVQGSAKDGHSGKVLAIEVIPELAEFGKNNVAKYNFINKRIVQFICADGCDGFKKEAPYDKILCSAAVHPHTKRNAGSSVNESWRDESFGAAAKKIPTEWKKQLKIGGIIVAPIDSSIWVFKKNPPVAGQEEFEKTEFPGFAFVPLVEK